MMTPKGNIVFKLEVMENRKSQPVEDAKGNGHFIFILFSRSGGTVQLADVMKAADFTLMP